jgi:hypothetical protein
LKASGLGDFRVCRIPALAGSVCPTDDRFHHSYAQWSLFKFSEKGGGEAPAWRVAEFTGMDRGGDGWKEIVAAQLGDAGSPELIVLDDAALGFRDAPELWSRLLQARKLRPWIVLKMSPPVAQGKLWEHLHRDWADRLVVVISADDLRRSEVQISRELSWERTAQDLAWELVHNPRVNALSDCAWLACSFGASGAFLMSQRKGTLFFDPQGIEGSWRSGHAGGMIGYNSCLAAAVARRLLLESDAPDMAAAVQAGVQAMRRLHQQGYGERAGNPAEPRLAFPAAAIASTLAESAAPCSVAEVQDPLLLLRRGEQAAKGAGQGGFWSILQDRHSQALEPLARRVVLEGPEAVLGDVPMGKFGGLLTVDRREIESFRGIRSLVAEYCSKSRQSRPLSIAVFGSPGSGKSFGVSEVARSLFPDLIQKLEFNVSQFTSVRDLHNALHQVRDTGLSGKIPLVFFDEFDAALEGQSLGWLRHFLMPMQDGAFLEGSVAHPLGTAIFVFAGGTSEKLATFGGHLSAEEFRKLKGPDFVSRLKGFVDIMGPNPVLDGGGADPYFVLRRAILLRSMIARQARQFIAKRAGQEIVNIDSGVLNAFLTTSRYKHGARSMETIMAMSQLAGKNCFERSCLPSEAQLDLHVDGLEFLALVQQIVLTPEILERLAEAAHEAFCQGKMRDGWRLGAEKNAAKKTHPLLRPYAEIPEWAKEANRANVRGIPQKLAAAGHVMIPARSNQPAREFPGGDLEKLAQLEHELWMADKIASGFQPGMPTAEDPNRSEYLVEWSSLPEDIKQIDRDLVKAIPKLLAAAGYAIEKIRQ